MNDPKPGMAGHDCEPIGYLEEADYHEEHNDDFAPGDDNEPLSLAEAMTHYSCTKPRNRPIMNQKPITETCQI